jgi:hypothetical protein
MYTKILLGKPERKRPLGRLRRRFEDNIRTDLGQNGKMWTAFICFRIGTSERLL